MARRSGRDLMRRAPGNPLITLKDMNFDCNDICNAGAIRLPEEYLLLLTIESQEGLSSIYKAHGCDGRHFLIEDEPFMSPSLEAHLFKYEVWGIRDARVTPLDGSYYITYVAEGDYGNRLALGRTDDFKSIERLGFISQPDTKNGAMFPRKIGGSYALLERPEAGSSIWLSFSDDLTYWGQSTVVLTPRGGFWDTHRVGAAGPPIAIEPGWLLIYYGVRVTNAGPVFRLGAAILDADDPSRVIARSNVPILSPRERYERVGDLPNVVFSCGAVLEKEEVWLYYGGADSCICLATARLQEIVDACMAGQRGS